MGRRGARTAHRSTAMNKHSGILRHVALAKPVINIDVDADGQGYEPQFKHH